MKNKTFPLTACIILTVTVAALTQSCRKVIDYVLAHENGQNDCRGCNIKQITVNTADELSNDTVVFTFTYNPHGDPLIVKNTQVATGNPNMVFKYDKFGRMTELVRPYSDGSYETWNKYSYNDKNQIIRDTQYIFGTYTDSVPVAFPQNGIWVRQFAYDAMDRIIQETDSIFNPGAAPFGGTADFSYDAGGNLLNQGTAYDSHLSILRTNRIWMFLCKNYSLNNGFQASSYNNHGLPLQFEGSYSDMQIIVPFSGQFVVQYGCQ